MAGVLDEVSRGRHRRRGCAMTATGQSIAGETGSELESTAAAVDTALAAVNDLDDDGRDRALALRDAIEAFHREGLVAIVTAMKADEEAKRVLFDLVDDPTVRALFLVHGIIRPDPMTAASQALDSIRPYLQSHGGDVELLSVADGIATVRLSGACNGCSMSAVTLQDGVREALVGAVDGITDIAVDDAPSVASTSAFIPVASVGVRRKGSTAVTASTSAAAAGSTDGPGPGWEAGPEIADLDPEKPQRVDFGSGKQAQSFLVTFVDNNVAVFRNECVHQGRPLDGGCLDEGTIVCPWHGFRFDAASGECLSAPAAQLVTVPARIDDGRVWIRTAS